MPECCTNKFDSNQYPRRHRCPTNGKEYPAVGIKTLLHHIKSPWDANLKNQGYYFCSDPDCEVVYFGLNNVTIAKSNVLTGVWEKELKNSQFVCYCFNVTNEQANKNKNIKQYVTQKTKESLCACEIKNPSGRCCLKNFPKL